MQPKDVTVEVFLLIFPSPILKIMLFCKGEDMLRSSPNLLSFLMHLDYPY